MNAGTRRRATGGRRAAAALTAALAAAGLAAGCSLWSGPPPAPAAPRTPPADSAWAATLEAARTAIRGRDFATAERTLTDFTRRYPQSSAASEAWYWWALARLDPANRGADPAAAVAVLDAYRASDPPRGHVIEAALLRGLIAQQDSLRLALSFERAAAAAASGSALAARAGLVPRDSLRARDEELARLRAEAAAAQAELERVRRRFTAPGARGGARP